jgi:type IV pilus assembly protein PilM
MRLGASKNLVGVDIQPGYVAAVEARPGHAAVNRAAVATLPPGVVRDGEVTDVDALAGVLRELFAEHKLPRHVRLGIANQKLVMRTLDLPPMDEAKQIASAVRFQAQEHIPMPLEQAVLEHHSLGVVETLEGPRLRVVLVAARRDMIELLLESARRAGLRPQGIDLSAFAMIRALHTGGETDPTLYVSVGGMTNLAVASATTCLFTRVVPIGSETMASQLAERRGLTMEHARSWLQHVGLLAALDDIDGEREIVVEARSILGDGVLRIAEEIRNSLEFHTGQAGSAAVGRAVLTGPAVSIPGFAEQLGQEVALPLQVGHPVEARPGGFGAAESGHLAIAAGLTVEEVAA